MSTAIQRLKKVRLVLGSDIPSLAKSINEQPTTIARAIMGYNQISGTLDKKVVEKLIWSGICPDCFAKTVAQGGCITCRCGWSMC